MSTITLPGKRIVRLTDSIIPKGNFTWDEATKGGSRIPESEIITEQIIRVAHALEEVRDYLGGYPMRVHSWYRPPSINAKVGGARDSRHLYGDAVDFSIVKIPPLVVYSRLNNWWGARGGLGKSKNFTHLDMRGTRTRWDY